MSDETETATDIGSAVESLIAQLSADEPAADSSAADVPGAPPAADAAPVDATPATPEKLATEPSTEPAKPVEPKPADPANDRSWERLAAREKEIADAQAAVEAERRKLSSLVSQFRRNPKEALKAIGIPEQEVSLVIRAAMADELPPDKVPAGYKAVKDKLELEDRFAQISQTLEAKNAALEAQLRQYQEREAAAKYQAEYTATLTSHLSSADVEAHTPHVARMAKAAPDKAQQRIMAIVSKDAQEKYAAVQAGRLAPDQARPLTPAEASKILEAELADLASVFGTATATTPNPAKIVATGKPSLSTRATPPAAATPVEGTVDDFSARVENWLDSNGLVIR